MKKTLVLSLGRNGSLPIYGEEICNNFINNKYDILISKNRFLKKKVNNSIELNTYTDKYTFLINTFFYFPIKFLFLIPKIIREYDTLYLPYQHFWDFPFILLFKGLKRRVVFTVHDGVLHEGEKNILTQFFTNIRIKNASEIIYLTDYVKNLVENELGIVKKYHIVPHPLIQNKFIIQSRKVNSSKNILFFGRIDKYKGIEILIQGANLVRKSYDKLIIAGKSEYFIDHVNDQKIEMIDKYLSEREIGELFNWADVLILPYKEASQSGVISLGIFAELPMICTKVGGFSEQLDNDECLWCNPNPESISEAIIEIFNKKDRFIKIKGKLKLKKKSLNCSIISNQIEKIVFK